MRFICFLILFFSTNLFASERELPVGTFPGVSFSLERNGISIFSNKEVHYHKSTLQIRKISSDIYEFTVAVYLQETPESKAFSDTRVDRYKVIWKSETMGTLINKKEEYGKDLSEFLLLAENITVKSLVSTSGVVETQTYKID
tara:strand:+ start:373 stop:801 length:429 start_codon:yes stop_codon:yes gene_type:complete